MCGFAVCTQEVRRMVYIVVVQYKNGAFFLDSAFNDLASAEAMALKLHEGYASGEYGEPIADVLVKVQGVEFR